MRLGVLLPTFRGGGDDAFALADEAARAGLDGVFAYDHLWPMGSPRRPSLAPFALLAVIARRYDGLVVGPLVARVGLVGTEHLVGEFRTLERIAPGRVIAALGAGDRLSAPENEAYGLALLSPDVRRALIRETALALAPVMPVWIGAGAEATNDLARELGATVNLWNADDDRVREVATRGPVNWAGPAPPDLMPRLDALAAAGATWAILSPEAPIEALGEWRSTQ